MSDEQTLDIGRFVRTLTLIVFVTTVFIIISAIRLEGVLFQIGTVAIGAVGFVTAIIGFLVSASQWFDATA
jgi:hypothetical protein